MKRNNKDLYEQIMRNVSREVKRALNENINNNLPIIRIEHDMELLDKSDFKKSSSYSKSIKFQIDLSYIFPDGDWENPIIPAGFEYFYSSKGIDNNYCEIWGECSEEELEKQGYSMEELDDYLYDNFIPWFYEYLGLNF